MGVTIQVRNLDPEVQKSLKKLAQSEGLSLSEYLRRTLTRVAERQRVNERWEAAVARHEAWVEELRRRPEQLTAPPLDISREEIVRMIHQGREERDAQLFAALGLEEINGDRD